jgi:hypothetical protein
MGHAGQIAANLKVTYGNKEYSLKPVLIFESEKISNPVNLPAETGEHKTVALSSIYADQKMIELTFGGFQENTEPEDLILVEVSKKPLMNFVWLGSILLTLGTIITFKRRFNAGT